MTITLHDIKTETRQGVNPLLIFAVQRSVGTEIFNMLFEFGMVLEHVMKGRLEHEKANGIFGCGAGGRPRTIGKHCGLAKYISGMKLAQFYRFK